LSFRNGEAVEESAADCGGKMRRGAYPSHISA
jgi:hypothetical protein